MGRFFYFLSPILSWKFMVDIYNNSVTYRQHFEYVINLHIKSFSMRKPCKNENFVQKQGWKISFISYVS